jgi:hypothetical protein
LLWQLALAAGAVAGMVAWLLGEPVIEYAQPETHKVEMTAGKSALLPTAESLRSTQVTNAALAFAILGAALGLSLGLTGGVARGDLRVALGVGSGGMLLGAFAGGITAFGLVPVYLDRFDEHAQGLTISLIMHSGIWSAIGAAAGLALGTGLGGWDRIARCLIGGLVGGLLGAGVYEVAGAAFFPLDKTYRPLSATASSRLFARLAVALCVAASSVIALRVSRRYQPAP